MQFFGIDFGDGSAVNKKNDSFCIGWKFHIIVFLVDAIFTFYMFFGRQIKFNDCSFVFFFLQTPENCVDTNKKYYLIVISCFHHTLDSPFFFTG